MAIQVEDLCYTYGEGTALERQALKHVSFEIQDGEFVGLIGHTGSGKSTLIQHLNGLIKPTSGDIKYQGVSIYSQGYKLKDLRSKVGLVFQYPEYQLFEADIFTDVCFGPKNLGLPQEGVEKRARHALKLVGMDEKFYKQSPFELSGGQKRRVAIAGVLAMRPEMMILDEPTAGLDPQGRDEILGQIERLNREHGLTILVVSHSMEDMARYVDRIMVMNDWPIIGIDKDGDGCGEPVLTYKKPNVGKTYPICTPQESDEFDGYTLSPQWQWHANINEKWAYYAGDKSYVRLYSYPVVEDYKNLWDVANLLLQKTPSDNFTATMKLTFSPNQKNKGERTGLVVMGRDYAGLVLENTDKGLVLSQVECDRADKGKPEEVKAAVDLSQNTVYLKVRFSCDGKKIKGSEGGHDLIVMCNFSYSLDGKKYESLGVPFQAREGQWIGAKVGMFCTRPAIKTNDGGWADVDWFRITKK